MKTKRIKIVEETNQGVLKETYKYVNISAIVLPKINGHDYGVHKCIGITGKYSSTYITTGLRIPYDFDNKQDAIWGAIIVCYYPDIEIVHQKAFAKIKKLSIK